MSITEGRLWRGRERVFRRADGERGLGRNAIGKGQLGLTTFHRNIPSDTQDTTVRKVAQNETCK